jgi:hypothetical protein
VVAHPRDQGDSRAARRLNEPRAARVEARDGIPVAVGGVPVAAVREEWRVADRWWTDEPVRRRYFDLVLETGENVAVFYGLEQDDWFRQKA